MRNVVKMSENFIPDEYLKDMKAVFEQAKEIDRLSNELAKAMQKINEDYSRIRLAEAKKINDELKSASVSH